MVKWEESKECWLQKVMWAVDTHTISSVKLGEELVSVVVVEEEVDIRVSVVSVRVRRQTCFRSVKSGECW